MPAEKVQVVVRLDRDLVKELDHRAVDWEVFRQDAVERLLRMGLQQVKLQAQLVQTGTRE